MIPQMLGSSLEGPLPEARPEDEGDPYLLDRLEEYVRLVEGGAVEAGKDVANAVGGPYGPNQHACAAGHPRNGKGDCKECRRESRRRHRPLKTRPCRTCGTIYSGSKRPVCPGCAKEQDAKDHAAELDATHRPVRTRTCTDCREARALDEFLRPNLRTQGERKGTKQYFDTCAVCRSDALTEDDGEGPDDSPYEVARLQVERIFGLPSKQWLNVRGHPLDLLHYSRMLAIHNARARAAGLPLLRADRMVPTRSLWSFIVQAQLTKRLRTPTAVLPLIAKAA